MMFDVKQVLDIAKKGKAEAWPYPKVFHDLKKAGVQSHEVWVEDFRSIYKNGSQECLEPIPDGFRTLKTADEFSKTAFEEVLSRRLSHGMTYVEFLSGIAAAGVFFYFVDMKAQTVTYKGRDEKYFYIQNIPDYME